MQRAITDFELDDVGEWMVVLECGHRQHVRHRPPWQERPWVLSAQGREERVGSSLECRACDEVDAEGGDPACWAHQVCPECGALANAGEHRAGCPLDDAGR